VSPLDLVISRLEQRGLRVSNDRKSGQCPAHDDRRPSLSIDEGEDGRVLLKCFAGCEVDAILDAIGLQSRDLFPSRNGNDQKKGGRADIPPRKSFEHSNTSAGGLTIEQYADAKRLPVAFLQQLGLRTISYTGQPAVRIPYFNSARDEAAVRFRLSLDGDNRFRWKSGAKPIPYGLWRLDDARRAGYVMLGEGESDSQTFWHHGIPAIGIPGASTWREAWAEHFDGIAMIYVVIEPDKGGDTVLTWLAKSRIRDRARLVRFQDAKDPSAVHLLDSRRFKERLQAALDAAEPWSRIEAQERQHNGAEAFSSAEALLRDPQLLVRLRETMAAQGYAGDCRAPLLAYVAVTSRLLDRPINLAFVAQSAAGKNRAVDAALELVPPAVFYLVRASSPRALVYCDENFEHRTIVVGEADSIPREGPAASAIRSIAEDSYVSYDVVERDLRTGKFETRHIVKPGPTGLITTTTASLDPQMATRVLEVPISDDATQTRKILLAHAARAMDHPTISLDLGAFHAAQQWLQVAGEHRVVVPFASVLAELVPDQAVRMRRDFRQLLTCIQTMALLHQCQRVRRADGSIEASIDDYAMTRDLLTPIFDTIVTDGITEAIRATIAAINVGEEISVAVLAERLKLARSTVHWRVSRAIKRDWLVNSETRKGHPARLSRGVPLPTPTSALPEVERVRQLFECSSRSRTGISPLPTAAEQWGEP
jgi:hypothetical protein